MATKVMIRRALDLPRVPESVREARAFIRKTLDGSPRLDDAELIASELTTNAVLHATGERFWLTVESRECRCLIEVEDCGSERTPRPGALPLDTEAGRGLGIVAVLATNYGYRHSPVCTVTWAELAY